MKTSESIEILSQYIEVLPDRDLCPLGAFTVVSNSIYDEFLLGEMVAASGKPAVIEVANFSPARMALHHTFAITQTDLKIKDEEHLNDTVSYLYKNHVMPEIKKFEQEVFPQLIDNIEKDVSGSAFKFTEGNVDLNNPTDKLFAETYKAIQARIENGEYQPGKYKKGENILSITTQIVEAKLYKQAMSDKISKITERAIETAVNEGVSIAVHYKYSTVNISLEKLSLHSGAERLTYLVVGPPACGKGGVVEGAVKDNLVKEGIEFEDLAKLNTDYNRPIISIRQPLGFDQSLHAALNNDESSFITDLSVERLNKKIANGAAPHILLDTVKLRQEKINLGTKEEGKVKIYSTTLDPTVSIPRAMARAKRISRSVPLLYMLTSHRDFPKQVTDCINNPENYGKPIEMHIYDSDVPLGHKQQLIESVDFSSKHINIVNEKLRQNLYSRVNINPYVTNFSYIYPDNYLSLYHDPFAGITQFSIARNNQQTLTQNVPHISSSRNSSTISSDYQIEPTTITSNTGNAFSLAMLGAMIVNWFKPGSFQLPFTPIKIEHDSATTKALEYYSANIENDKRFKAQYDQLYEQVEQEVDKINSAKTNGNLSKVPSSKKSRNNTKQR